jgi:hypothetical protein
LHVRVELQKQLSAAFCSGPATGRLIQKEVDTEVSIIDDNIVDNGEATDAYMHRERDSVSTKERQERQQAKRTNREEPSS